MGGALEIEFRTLVLARQLCCWTVSMALKWNFKDADFNYKLLLCPYSNRVVEVISINSTKSHLMLLWSYLYLLRMCDYLHVYVFMSPSLYMYMKLCKSMCGMLSIFIWSLYQFVNYIKFNSLFNKNAFITTSTYMPFYLFPYTINMDLLDLCSLLI